MTPRALLVSGTLALTLLATGCSTPAAMPGPSAMSSSPTAMTPAMSASPTGMMSGAMSSSPTGMMTDAMSAHGSYVTRATYTTSMAAYADSTVVYFFSASSSSMSQASDKALTSDPGAIPAKVTVVKVDLASASDLAGMYGVTMPDTYVQVDKTGAKVMSWSGQPVATVLAALKG